MRESMNNLALAQAVSDLAALLDYKQQRSEATLLYGEANELASGTSDERGYLYALQRLNRIRGGIQTVLRLPLEPDERTRAETIALRIQRALSLQS